LQAAYKSQDIVPVGVVIPNVFDVWNLCGLRIRTTAGCCRTGGGGVEDLSGCCGTGPNWAWVRKWVSRYEAGGEAALVGRSRRPYRSPSRL